MKLNETNVMFTFSFAFLKLQAYPVLLFESGTIASHIQIEKHVYP